MAGERKILEDFVSTIIRSPQAVHLGAALSLYVDAMGNVVKTNPQDILND